jgi:hypothetical protein
MADTFKKFFKAQLGGIQEESFPKSSHTYNFMSYHGHKHTQHFKASDYVKHNKRYFKLDYNQLQMLDGLMNSGGYEKRYIDRSKNLRFSEHFGLLDFSKTRLQKIIVSAKTGREDEDDMEILLPMDLPDIKEYEYMFHTHPPTPFPGSRVQEGIIYEFPSISDIYHFADHYNSGETQGSLVIAPEGIYIIKAIDGLKKIEYPKLESVYDELVSGTFQIQQLAIDKYNLSGDVEVNSDLFYSEIAHDNEFIRMFNRLIEYYWGPQIKIYLKPRVFDEKVNKWIIKSLLLPVMSYELK